MGDPISENQHVIQQQSCFLSDDLLIEEVLTRLPIKSILRFKAVSKQWYSTLSSSDFATLYLMKSSFAYPSAPVNTLFINSVKNYYLFFYDDDQICGNFEDNLVKIDVDFGIENNDYFQVSGSCNGLICLTPDSHKYFILWNPSTRKMHKYETDVYIKRIDDETEADPLICGFWHASSVDDYKFVRVLKPSFETYDTNGIVHILSLRENKWTTFHWDFGVQILAAGHPMLTNERLYWPAFCLPDDRVIISFDLVVERFEVIKLEDTDCLGVMGGYLSKCDSDIRKTIHIFESPGVILKSIGFPKCLRLGMTSQMVGFTKTGRFFVTGAFNGEMISIDTRMLGVVDTGTEPMQYTTLLSFDKLIDITRYVPSLVSPFPLEKLSRA
ncbi:F-box/kelch-repeat protein At3g23880-like [Silene latifolia]|uniref:F-box/kelch-repeat protein At3g23880-like n=1 Tax=Silene latifolia TaxID=37657 RepID=UPI003D779F7E